MDNTLQSLTHSTLIIARPLPPRASRQRAGIPQFTGGFPLRQSHESNKRRTHDLEISGCEAYSHRYISMKDIKALEITENANLRAERYLRS